MICVRCDSKKCTYTEDMVYAREVTSSGSKMVLGAGYTCEACGFKFKDENTITDFQKEIIDLWRASRKKKPKFGTDTSGLFAIPRGKYRSWTK